MLPVSTVLWLVTSVKPHFKNVLHSSIELPLGSIFQTTQPFVKKPTTVKTSRENDLTKEQFFFRNSKLRNGMASSKKKERKNRSSRPEVFYRKGVLRNFVKFTGKQLCHSPFFNKVAGLACNFIKKETLALVFSCKFCEISKNTFY